MGQARIALSFFTMDAMRSAASNSCCYVILQGNHNLQLWAFLPLIAFTRHFLTVIKKKSDEDKLVFQCFHKLQLQP